jgi:hypothetical protein
MDYLDPKKKREHKIRLLVGYSLFAVAIGFATVLLVYMANGYYLDRATGEVIQNGLMYVDARPGSADIYLNGEKQRGGTDARLVVPAGKYTIDLKREGYRNWSRSLVLEGGSLRRLTYARLIPTTLTTSSTIDLRSDPVDISQSIDKKWLVLSYADNPLLMQSIDLEQATVAPVAVQLPQTIVSNPNGRIKIIEWADDNKTFLATYTVGESVEYLLVDRENPALAQNLTAVYGDAELQIQLQDRKKDLFFAYKPSSKSIFTASLSDGLSTVPILTKVETFKTFGRDWILYMTPSTTDGLIDLRFKRGDKDILIRHAKKAESYLLQLAKLGTAPVMGFSSTEEDKAFIYNDPEKYLNDNPGVQIPIATTVLRVEDPIDLRISADSSVVMAYGPTNFASHEFEADRSYTFKVDAVVDPAKELRWIDGQHFQFSSNGTQMMADFDGSNVYDLVPSIASLGSFYREDFSLMYTFAAATAKTDRAPATPTRLTVTNLLIESDR